MQCSAVEKCFEAVCIKYLVRMYSRWWVTDSKVKMVFSVHDLYNTSVCLQESVVSVLSYHAPCATRQRTTFGSAVSWADLWRGRARGRQFGLVLVESSSKDSLDLEGVYLALSNLWYQNKGRACEQNHCTELKVPCCFIVHHWLTGPLLDALEVSTALLYLEECPNVSFWNDTSF